MNRIVSNNKSGFEFKPGYHEWNLFKKNKLLYTFSDFTELLFSYEFHLKKAVELLVDELIEEMMTSAKDEYITFNFKFTKYMRNKILNLTPLEIKDLKEEMNNRIFGRYRPLL